MVILCTIDLETREVSLPAGQVIASYDHNVDVIRFQAEAIPGFSLDTSSIKIAAQGPNKARHDYAVDPSTVQIEEETGYITFDWPIPAGVTEMPLDVFKYGDKGQLIFAVCAEIIDGSTVSKAWHSDDGIITVVAHLEPESGGGEDPEEEATNAQKIGQLQTATAILQREISGIASGAPPTAASTDDMDHEVSTVYINTTDGNWYFWNGTAWTSGGTYGGAVTDTTLSISGKPADAKAVGDALAELESGSSGGLTADIKSALLACFAHVAWEGTDGQDYIDALESALNPPANLSSITCVYTQSGTVYDTASLDDLKTDLVVTAHWSDNTTSTVTTYTLSGTLTEGTSTITVTFGGKTTTFNVTVSVYNTSPSIGVEGSSLKANGTTRSNAGACYTNAYTYELDINAFKQTEYYNEPNNYSTENGALWKITYNVPNSNSASFSGYTAVCFYDSNDTFIDGTSMTFDGTKKTVQASRYNTGYFTLSDNIVKLKFTLPIADVEDSYAYWASPLSGILPVGVTAGDIIFAGRNTPYWGCSNISEASS